MSAKKTTNPIVHGSIERKIVSSDLIEERSHKDWTGSIREVLKEEAYVRMDEAAEFMQSHPGLLNDHKFYDMTRSEMQKDLMRKGNLAFKLGKEKWFLKHEADEHWWGHAHLGLNPLTLNYTMFLNTITGMMTDEQRAKWEPLTRQGRILGSYAQTEIGHGSDVAGLETTATFDKETDEFIIDCPTPTATKWWPGDLGLFVTHATIFARLIIDGNSYGIIPFLVQIRDHDTFMPLPGVRCGDMGPKLGYASKNNGWLHMTKLRIPRDQMMMKYTKVDRNGDFSIEGDTRVLYSVMMNIRTQLIYGAAESLSKGLMIALRYSCVRRQFKNTTGSKQETKLIDYQTQQMKLIPLLATAFGMGFSHRYVFGQYKQLLEDIKVEKFDLLDELHHFTSGMKSVFTQTCNDGLLQVRQSIGGAGFTAWSGLPYIIDEYSPCVTFEGDNTVMAQQCNKFLMKLVKKVHKGETVTGYFTYLNQLQTVHKSKSSAKTAVDFANIDHVEEALKVLSSICISQTVKALSEVKGSKKQIANEIMAIDIVKMAQLHVKVLTFLIFRQSISGFADKNLQGHMTNLCSMMGLNWLQEYTIFGYDTGYFQKGTQVLMNEAIKILLNRIRPQVIPLVELWGYHDSELVSAIGNSYGDIYETHLKWAQESRLNDNKGSIPDGYMEYIMPILQGKL